jgi:PAS domain S-box-containing protein
MLGSYVLAETGWCQGGTIAGRVRGIVRALPEAPMGTRAMSDQPASILYVDDDEINRQALTWILRREGFRTREATTGSDALRMAEEHPDLIILDVNLPDIDGFEVCRRIKAHPSTAAIPVLHMSGVFVSTHDKTQGLEGGADGYLTKPVAPEEVVATVRSLLRIHHAEEAARAAARQWQATFDAIHDALGVLDREGRLVRCNQAMADLFGRPVAELLGRPYAVLLEETFGPAATALVSLLREAAPSLTREVILGNRCFRVTADPVLDERANLGGRVHLLADITEQKRLEERLLQAQKLEAVGRLAGGVAHDFNNLLTAILGNLSLVLGQMPADSPQADMLRVTEKAAWRAADLTRQLLGFSRQTRLWLRPTDLNHCVNDTLDLIRRTLDPRIELLVQMEPDLWPVLADAGQMGQVLMNLCLNARDAMPDGGRLVVSTANVTRTEAVSGASSDEVATERHSGEFVRLQVSDNGHGIPVEIQTHIFDPFFTTKEHGRGTGLGLAVVFGIVQQHKGWIECRSIVGKGTTFDLYLPRYDEPDPAPTEG